MEYSAYNPNYLIAVPASDSLGCYYSVYVKITTKTGFELGDKVGEIRVDSLPLDGKNLG